MAVQAGGFRAWQGTHGRRAGPHPVSTFDAAGGIRRQPAILSGGFGAPRRLDRARFELVAAPLIGAPYLWYLADSRIVCTVGDETDEVRVPVLTSFRLVTQLLRVCLVSEVCLAHHTAFADDARAAASIRPVQ